MLLNLPMNRQIQILPLSKDCVADFSSKVTVARPNSSSLRTTIPEAVVKMMELEAGDEMVWTVKPIKDGVAITLSKRT